MFRGWGGEEGGRKGKRRGKQVEEEGKDVRERYIWELRRGGRMRIRRRGYCIYRKGSLVAGVVEFKRSRYVGGEREGGM